MPKLSIITINYNDREGLSKTISSVQEQSSDDYEHIIIDGGSDDGSADLIREHAAGFSHWVSESDQGIYHAMNKGIKASTGDYLLFLNSGDYLYDSQVISRLVEEIKDGLDLYYGSVWLVDHKGKSQMKSFPAKLTFSYFAQNTITHQVVVIKRALFEQVFYLNENLKIASDWEFLICAICKHNATYRQLDLDICYYNTDGISSRPETKVVLEDERKRSLERHFPRFLDDLDELIRKRKRFQGKRFKTFLELERHKRARSVNHFFSKLILKLFKW